MLTIDLTNNYTMKILFDEALTMEVTGKLFSAINRIDWAFHNYPFKDATVINNATGELLLTVKNE